MHSGMLDKSLKWNVKFCQACNFLRSTNYTFPLIGLRRAHVKTAPDSLSVRLLFRGLPYSTAVRIGSAVVRSVRCALRAVVERVLEPALELAAGQSM